MGDKSSIEWTEATWNPVAGCSVVSAGCTNCYAMRMARRLELMGQPKYVGTTRVSGGRAKWNGNVVLDEKSLSLPYKWKAGRRIFVNSMSDLFHEKVPVDFMQRVFHTMRDTPQHTYQILTKRAERLSQLSEDLIWPENVWMGVSVESEDFLFRIDCLRKTGAAIKFLSLEPLLGPLMHLDLGRIDWVIVGGESGPGARSLQPDWVRSIRDQCQRQGKAFHFKQWGGTNKKKTGRTLDNRTWDEYPSLTYA
ncbi:MAG: phage Gp37/Gp68 family protein [Acetobacterales bacterium]